MISDERNHKNERFPVGRVHRTHFPPRVINFTRFPQCLVVRPLCCVLTASNAMITCSDDDVSSGACLKRFLLKETLEMCVCVMYACTTHEPHTRGVRRRCLNFKETVEVCVCACMCEVCVHSQAPC